MALAGELVKPYSVYHEFHNFNGGRLRVMDNGIWEAEAVSDSVLVGLGLDYGFNELIAPDVLNDPDKTFAKTYDFLHYLPLVFEPKIAVVVHGQTQRQAQEFIRNIHALNDARVTTLMIGRAFSRHVGNRTARYTLAAWIKQEFGDRYQIHLLGYNDPWGPAELAACQGIVRSMDTVAPFTAALAGVAIDSPACQAAAPPRPADYFDLPTTAFPKHLVEHNIEVLDEWAGAIDWRNNG
jgi:hypothetical protein